MRASLSHTSILGVLVVAAHAAAGVFACVDLVLACLAEHRAYAVVHELAASRAVAAARRARSLPPRRTRPRCGALARDDLLVEDVGCDERAPAPDERALIQHDALERGDGRNLVQRGHVRRECA